MNTRSWQFTGRLALLFFASCISRAQPLDQIDASAPRDVQVRIAKQAAPPEVSDHAAIYVLGPKGYELAQPGSNGFSCLIEREKPNTMEPECFDAEGSRTTLKVALFVEAQRARKHGEGDISRQVKNGYKSGRFQAPRRPGLVYMLSASNYVFDPDTKRIIHFPGHLMFYAPYATERTVGSGSGAPYIVHPGQPDALLIVVPAK